MESPSRLWNLSGWFLLTHTNQRNSIHFMGLHHSSLYRRRENSVRSVFLPYNNPVSGSILARIPCRDFKTIGTQEFGRFLCGQLVCFLGFLNHEGM